MGMKARARVERARKAGEARTPAKAAAARLNGTLGGRPRKGRIDAFADITDPPVGDPLATAVWAQGIAARALHEVVQGRGLRERDGAIRAFAGVISRLVPMERIAEAEKRIRLARAPAKPFAKVGPDLQPIPARDDDDGPMRG